MLTMEMVQTRTMHIHKSHRKFIPYDVFAPNGNIFDKFDISPHRPTLRLVRDLRNVHG